MTIYVHRVIQTRYTISYNVSMVDSNCICYSLEIVVSAINLHLWVLHILLILFLYYILLLLLLLLLHWWWYHVFIQTLLISSTGRRTLILHQVSPFCSVSSFPT